MKLSPFCLDTVKGWTRATVVAFIALAAMEFDLNDASHLEMLKPLSKVLDRAWLLPMHAAWLFGLMFIDQHFGVHFNESLLSSLLFHAFLPLSCLWE